MLPNSISIKWYNTIESTPSNTNIEGPHTKFWVNQSWDVHIRARNIGAKEVVGRGIKKTSFAKNLTKSAAI